MARVVQRRGGPSYLLFVFVFVAFIATTLAVIFYTGKEEAAQARDRQSKARGRAEDEVRAYENTIVPKLIRTMTGTEGAINLTAKKPLDEKAIAQALESVLKEVEQVLSLEHSKDANNLSEAVRNLNQQVSDNLTRIKQLLVKASNLNEELRKQVQAVKDLKATYDRNLKIVTGKWNADRADFAKELQAKDKQLERATTTHTKTLADRDQQITAQAQKIEKLKRDLQLKDVRMAELKGIIRDLKGPGADPGTMVMRKADGKIVKVLTEEKVCYINLGEKDNVKAGVPFSVYSPKEGIPDSGEGVAKILVINVGQITSECRIVESKKDDPIAEGYLVANLVFNVARTYSFVVRGEFDLYAEGRSDPEAGRKIRKFIESFGGKIEEKVSVTTDFVIMGRPPVDPPKPSEDQPEAWAAYNRLLKKIQEYKTVKDVAESLRIPALNTSRFLAFTGYVPRRRLVE